MEVRAAADTDVSKSETWGTLSYRGPPAGEIVVMGTFRVLMVEPQESGRHLFIEQTANAPGAGLPVPTHAVITSCC
jgi:hypothetical protein